MAAQTEVAAESSLRQWVVALTVASGNFVTTLEISTSVALPFIASRFQVDVATVQWLVILYFGTRVGLLIGAGGAADLFGLKRFYVLGLILYAIASLVAAFSPSFAALLGLRMFMAVGIGFIQASGPALIGRTFGAGRRGRGLGVAMAGVALGQITGALAGGLLVQRFGWEAAFLIRVPTGILSATLAFVVLREYRSGGRVRDFDFVGMATLFVGLFSLLVGVNLARQLGWTSPILATLFVVSAVFLASFYFNERRARSPVLDLGLFRIRGFNLAASAPLVLQVALWTIWTLFPFYITGVLKHGPFAVGLMMAVMSIVWFVVSPGAGWLSDRIGSRHISISGLALVSLGFFFLSFLGDRSSLALVAVGMMVLGLGAGSFGVSNQNLMLNSVPKERFGTASASLGLAGAMGNTLCVAVFAAFFVARKAAHSGVEYLAFQDVFRLAAIIVLAAAVLYVMVGRGLGPRKEGAPP